MAVLATAPLDLDCGFRDYNQVTVSFEAAGETRPGTGTSLDFQPKSESALETSNDDDLIEYISSARNAGETAHFRKAMGILAFRRIDMVRAKIQLKVKLDQDIEDLTMIVMADALRAKFEGTHIGEFVNTLNTIIRRRIADFYSRNTLETGPLADEHEGDDEVHGETPSVDAHDDRVVTQAAIDADLAELSPAHRMAIELYLDGFPANEVAEQVNADAGSGTSEMTAPNVHQITKRFRDRMHLALESEPGSED